MIVGKKLILLNFFIGIFSIFISPQIFLYYTYPNIKYSFVLIYGLILSLTGSWLLILITYYFNLSNTVIYILMLLIMLSSLIFMDLHRKFFMHKKNNYMVWIIAIIAIMPLLKYSGTIFTAPDAVQSWHKWALDLYANTYHPIDAAYPVLIPALWAILYKIQNTNEIWWTARMILFVFPLFAITIPLTLYRESKNLAFIFMVILLYPYILWSETIVGNMDMPVMILGTLSLMVMYTADIYKGKQKFKYYAYGSLLLAGLASITKQAGLAFIVFDFMYVLLNIKWFKNKKELMIVCGLTIAYFSTYLSIYYLNATHGATGNIAWLKYLSEKKYETQYVFWNTFFSYPPYIPTFSFLNDLKPITPYLLGFGIIVFFLKKEKKYNSIEFLSLIFLVIGYFAWTNYFSYDARNSYWVKSFLIVFVSINLKYFMDWYRKKDFSPIGFFFLLISFALIFFSSISNTFAYDKQELYQNELGDKKWIKRIVHVLDNKKKCTKIYTNYHYLLYSLQTKKIQKKIVDGEFDLHFLRQSVEDDCDDGTYIVFRTTTITYPMWKYVRRLEKDGKIKKYKGSHYIYYVPPHTKLKVDYFEK